MLTEFSTESANWGHPHDRIGIMKCWFLRIGENRSTRTKTPRRKDENQQQTQPTYDTRTGNRTRATLVGGECSHHCAADSWLSVLYFVSSMLFLMHACYS